MTDIAIYGMLIGMTILIGLMWGNLDKTLKEIKDSFTKEKEQ